MRQQHRDPAPSRRAFLGGAASLGAAAALPEWPTAVSAPARGDHRGFRVSLSVSPFSEAVLASLAGDLDAPAAVGAVDAWADATLGTDGLADTSDPEAGATIHALLDAALGLAL